MSHNSCQAQALKESGWASIMGPWGPKACFCLLQDFSKICKKSLCDPIASKTKIDSVQTRCIVKTSGFTRDVCKKIRDLFIKFKIFLVEFLESRRSWENQKPPENRQKSELFWASPFTMHLVCTLLRKKRRKTKMHKPAGNFLSVPLRKGPYCTKTGYGVWVRSILGAGRPSCRRPSSTR